MCSQRYGFHLTDKLTQNVGVPNGDRLAPLFFTIFVANLELILRNTEISGVFYADEFVLGHTELSKLQQAILIVEQFCVNVDLEVNTGKTKVMKTRKASRLRHYDQLTYRNTLLEFVTSFNYLGVILQTNAKPIKHLKHSRRRGLFGTKTPSMRKDLAKLQLKTAWTLFESIIFPSATYCLEIFGKELTDLGMQRHIKFLHSLFTRDGRESYEDYRQNN